MIWVNIGVTAGIGEYSGNSEIFSFQGDKASPVETSSVRPMEETQNYVESKVTSNEKRRR